MNGAADMGGMHGFGPVEIEPNEPVFHADWEKKAFALNMAIGVGNIWNLDAFRFARESLPPPQYLNTSYYGLWVVTLENMMLKYGITTNEELKVGHALAPLPAEGGAAARGASRRIARRGGRPAAGQPRPRAGDLGDAPAGLPWGRVGIELRQRDPDDPGGLRAAGVHVARGRLFPSLGRRDGAGLLGRGCR